MWGTEAVPPDAPSLRGFANQPTVLRHHAAILDHVDAGARELPRGAVVTDTELEPHGPWTPGECEDLACVAGQIFRSSEDVDHVRRLPQIGERPHDGLAEDRLSDERRIHGQNPVAARLPVR